MTAAELLSPGGECAECQEHADERVIVALPQGGSGPGGPARLACLPCARDRARSPLAPDWLAEDLAAIDAERQRSRIEQRGAP